MTPAMTPAMIPVMIPAVTPVVTPPMTPEETPAVSPVNPTNTKLTPAKRSTEMEYPVDVFSLEQRRQGWILLHFFGMLYMFVALAIVCDDYFVPALEVIIEKLEISEDVAGATFMAAGGSAPELFTSLIGVFIAHSNIGIGTIVGSAVFNILFVIGMCAIFAQEVLSLTWWPLFRDVSFYFLNLMLLILFFLDNEVQWYESLVLLLGYLAYVVFMKFNAKIEKMVKRSHFGETRFKCIAPSSWSRSETEASSPDSKPQTKPESDAEPQRPITIQPLHISWIFVVIQNLKKKTTLFDIRNRTLFLNIPEAAETPAEEEEEEKSAPSVLEWPKTRLKQLQYLLQLPIVLLLWVTVPNVQKPFWRRFFALTFFLSILWIAAFSYLMVWWAHQTMGISEEIMGLTILAAGTSIPDLITSVIVARKGLGDMAVSSSVGSNIFDITVGSSTHPLAPLHPHSRGDPVAVSSNGLFCAIVLLFLMLIFVIVSIAACRWRMNRILGLTMFCLYFLFLLLSILLENRTIPCPVTV
ncbi:hypothetical protein WMY93_012563 [Mugilogobius chulae]|uniref:Sodium/calcium exchanger membrane region domain-containing protein n=1 Tax=Mugilogobius chulae TaxID=88201 RepID=A0AAW0P7L3_9GOBI